jgi:chemotaxis protein MotA
MNPSGLIGILATVLFLAIIVVFGADSPMRFVDPVGLAVVVGGTLAATFMSYPPGEVLRSFRLASTALKQERLHSAQHIEELVQISRLWIRGELQAVEKALTTVTNPFLRTGVQLVIDRTPDEYIHDLLHWRMLRLQQQEAAEAQIFKVMANYAPAFGMLGTLLGLINLMDLLGAGDVKGIGVQLGIALLTTLYGVILSNMVFKPLALRLERRTERRLALMNMILEGISMMSAGHSPGLMRETLKSFVAQIDDELSDARTGAKPASARKR